MSGRFPGAKNIEDFWQNLCDGVESIHVYSPEELAEAGVDPAVHHHRNYVNVGSILEDIDLFDASFFGLSPREAESMDPQQRLFMECAWHALEDAGYDPDQYKGNIGVFAGSAMSTYFQQLLKNPEFVARMGFLQVLVGNDKDYLTTHASYKLNLRGPSISIQSTCATSLVAICMACQNLLSRQSDMALAGGVCVRVPHKTGYYHEPGGIFSPDGHCRVFDAKAQGMIFGNGVGLVVLKRLADALADGDCIHAIVKAAALNNDGSSKASYAAPGLAGQAAVIKRAYAEAGIQPATIGYIEAHGTGTVMGDPVEIAGLTQAFCASTQKKGYCAIGSVKTNFGHLDHAAGIAGFFKTVLSLKHKMLPPSLHFETPNPAIDFAQTPFYVNSRLSEWKQQPWPRRAGVSAFGIGGTNAHVVLEEAPPCSILPNSHSSYLLVLSARTKTALDTATENLAKHLRQHPGQNLADIAYTYQVGRRAFAYRRMLVCQAMDDALAALEGLEPKRVTTERNGTRNRPVIFMFSGQGSQYPNMGADLYRAEPVFREQVDRCSELLSPILGLDLRHAIYPHAGQTGTADMLRQTRITQPALFVVEFALASLWMDWGVQPHTMIGHSVGEFVAACLAGVFSVEDALKLVAERGRLMQSLPSGSMLAVPLPEAEVLPLLQGKVCLAAVNDRSMCVVAGHTDRIEQLVAQLGADGIECRHLHTSHAFHSAMMDPIIEPFAEVVRKIDLKPPKLHFVSSVTGTWITQDQATNPDYWARHVREPVRFADGLDTVFDEEGCILLEVGPGMALSTFARRHPKKSTEQRVFSSLRHPQESQKDTDFILNTLGRLWLLFVQIDWSQFHRHERHFRMSLPTYPFERQRYWVEPANEAASVRARSSIKKPDITDWFYAPSWKRGFACELEDSLLGQQRLCWLIFEDACGVGANLVHRLEQKEQTVLTVKPGTEFARIGVHLYSLDPQRPEHYDTLLADIVAQGQIPDKIVHMWSITGKELRLPEIELFQVCQELGFYSLLWLTQALAKNRVMTPVDIGVVSNGMHLVNGDEQICPAKATILGACKSIPQEYLNLRCKSIDIAISPRAQRRNAGLSDHLIGELVGRSRDAVVAYRGGQRWLQSFEPAQLKGSVECPRLLREQGVYLITGGLGNIGLALAEELARTARARLVLTGRSEFPAPESWEQWLESHPADDRVSGRIRRLQAIEKLGAQILVCDADVSDEAEMRHLVERIYAHFGDLNGVIYGAGTLVAESFFGIDQATRHLCDLHFQPKVKGLLVLEKALYGKPLDFWFLLSSLSAILAGLGFTAYSAANNFQDALAFARSSHRGTPWISVNWDAWELQENWALAAMLPTEGTETFRRILSQASLRQVAVSISDLPARIDLWINPEMADETQGADESATLHERPELENEYVAPRTEMEQKLAKIWQDTLGVAQVGMHDNFFSELGGHSLLAMLVVARVRSQFCVDLASKRFMEAPTVAELAVVLDTLIVDVNSPV